PEVSIGTSIYKDTQNFISNGTTSLQSEFIDNKGLILGARVFAGVEYFFLPKISVGGEVGYGVKANILGKTTQTYFNGASSNFTNFFIDASPDILGGQIYLLFHL
ncbi:MAG: hypothetical protein M3421_15245, partial [Bacteroidota bacterium]|nr:hypothetical protein [Bacteroidota bacterium]